MPVVKLSDIVALHSQVRPVISKTLMDIDWEPEDEALLRRIAQKANKWGSDPELSVEHDVPLGIGDADHLIRLILALYDIHSDLEGIKRRNFERLCRRINPEAFEEVAEDIFGE